MSICLSINECTTPEMYSSTFESLKDHDEVDDSDRGDPFKLKIV